jgi:tetratricopeptide (TPR) repeat protein
MGTYRTLRRRVLVVLIPAAILGFASPDRSRAHPGLEAVEQAVGEELARRPDDPETHLHLGEVYETAHEWDAALDAYAHALDHGADRDLVGLARGRVLLQAGRPREALVELDAVVARRPDAFAARFERGRARERLARHAQAADDFARAIAGMPEPRPENVLARRDALLALGRVRDAIRALDQGMARIGHVPSLELPALDLDVRLRRWPEALRRLDRLLAQTPGNADWIARRGEVLAAAGRRAEARAEFARALALLEVRPAGRSGTRIQALADRLRAALASADLQGGP